VFVRNTFLLPQQNGNNSNANGYMTFDPQISLPASGVLIPLEAMAKHLLETNGDNALTNRVAPSPFASKVAKSQTQGAVFVNSNNTFANSKDAVTSESYLAGLGYSVRAIMKFKEHKDAPTQLPIGTPICLLFVAAALLFLPAILGVTGSTIFGGSGGTVTKPAPNDAINQSLGLFASPAFVSSRAELSNQMLASGVSPQEAQKISQALITMWVIAISVGVKDMPANTRNEIAAYVADSCAACTPQMIGAVMTKSEQLVISNPALRLDQAQLKEVAIKINTAVKNTAKTDQDILGGESGKQIFIKTLQGKNITL
jgi:intracellular multiplication protein IcmD